jgi:CRP/FNR family transcriptional regulator, cyclic AMP receptor protein
MVTVQDLHGFRLFAGLAENELSGIATLCRRQIYGCNSVIFDPETPSKDIFLVEQGNDVIQIEIPLGGHEGKMVIHTLSQGETLGWAALGSQHTKTATSRCLERASVLAIDGKDLMQLLETNNHVGYLVMRNLADIISTRLAYTTVAFRHEMRKMRKMVAV